MRIALCDDESAENQNMLALIEKYALKNDYPIQCEAFTSGKKLLEQDRFDLYFLDYKMNEIDGLAVAAALNEKFNGAVTVCFLTNYETAAIEIINRQIYADGVLKKPVSADLLYEKLDRFYKTSSWGRLELKQGRSYRTVYARDIIYIEASKKESIVYYKEANETFSHMLSEMERILSDGNIFIRIHRSFIINMMYVSSYDTKSVTMTNGVTLPLKTKEFQRVYREYIFHQMQ